MHVKHLNYVPKLLQLENLVMRKAEKLARQKPVMNLIKFEVATFSAEKKCLESLCAEQQKVFM